jgi:purine-binding chemotaxis protein CheW
MSATTSPELAAVSRTATAAAVATEWLTFRLGHEEYGIDILRVQEIRSYEAPTRIAGAPEHIKGVIDLRGVIVPVIDLRMKLGCTEVRYDDLTVVIVLNVGAHIVGAVVDSVSDVLELSANDIRPFPDMSSTVESACITGIGSLRTDGHDRMLILLDIASLVAGTELGRLDLAATA